MRINIKKFLIISLVLASAALPLFAQRTGSLGGSRAPVKPTLTVNCNITDATVEIKLAEKYATPITGSAPFSATLSKGSYSVTVSAPGYKSQSKGINLSSSTTLNFNLEADNYSLSVTSNVGNAQVQIKGTAVNGTIVGNTSYSTQLPPGTYTVRVNAPGFYAQEKTIRLSGPLSVDFQLQPQTAQLNIEIPNNILNYTISNPESRIEIYDNGSRINGRRIQLNPGQHTIRIVSGAFAAQQTINVNAGEIYTINLGFGFDINKN